MQKLKHTAIFDNVGVGRILALALTCLQTMSIIEDDVFMMGKSSMGKCCCLCQLILAIQICRPASLLISLIFVVFILEFHR